MFTGIVTQRATVVAAERDEAEGGARFRARFPRGLSARVGDSVAIDGCCLTVTARDGDEASFDVVPETLRRTTLRGLGVGARVNAEEALRAGDPLGGHVVQGHVDGVGTVVEVTRVGDDVRMTIALPPRLVGATVPKGSVAVDGVSLTVGESSDERFSVYLIPHTLAETGLAEKRAGDGVNLEADVIGRYVEHHVRRILSKEVAR